MRQAAGVAVGVPDVAPDEDEESLEDDEESLEDDDAVEEDELALLSLLVEPLRLSVR